METKRVRAGHTSSPIQPQCPKHQNSQEITQQLEHPDSVSSSCAGSVTAVPDETTALADRASPRRDFFFRFVSSASIVAKEGRMERCTMVGGMTAGGVLTGIASSAYIDQCQTQLETRE